MSGTYRNSWGKRVNISAGGFDKEGRYYQYSNGEYTDALGEKYTKTFFNEPDSAPSKNNLLDQLSDWTPKQFLITCAVTYGLIAISSVDFSTEEQHSQPQQAQSFITTSKPALHILKSNAAVFDADGMRTTIVGKDTCVVIKQPEKTTRGGLTIAELNLRPLGFMPVYIDKTALAPAPASLTVDNCFFKGPATEPAVASANTSQPDRLLARQHMTSEEQDIFKKIEKLIGLSLEKDGDYFRVAAVTPGGVASREDIRTGDQIREIDDTIYRKVGPDRILKAVEGFGAGHFVKFDLRRPNVQGEVSVMVYKPKEGESYPKPVAPTPQTAPQKQTAAPSERPAQAAAKNFYLTTHDVTFLRDKGNVVSNVIARMKKGSCVTIDQFEAKRAFVKAFMESASGSMTGYVSTLQVAPAPQGDRSRCTARLMP